jgi:hypothetical protein
MTNVSDRNYFTTRSNRKEKIDIDAIFSRVNILRIVFKCTLVFLAFYRHKICDEVLLTRIIDKDKGRTKKKKETLHRNGDFLKSE